MQKNSTLIHDLTFEQFNSLFSGLQNQLTELKKNFEPKTTTGPNYITKKEAAKILRLGLTKLNELTKSGAIPTYRIGCNVRLIESEVRDSLSKVKTSVPTAA
ncbi:MAG: helix-turn-helix domain-containing protein [Bacteroidota bacterium]